MKQDNNEQEEFPGRQCPQPEPGNGSLVVMVGLVLIIGTIVLLYAILR